MEFELMDTGVFNEDRYFDIFVEYAKASPEDVVIRVEIFNRGPADAELPSRAPSSLVPKHLGMDRSPPILAACDQASPNPACAPMTAAAALPRICIWNTAWAAAT